MSDDTKTQSPERHASDRKFIVGPTDNSDLKSLYVHYFGADKRRAWPVATVYHLHTGGGGLQVQVGASGRTYDIDMTQIARAVLEIDKMIGREPNAHSIGDEVAIQVK